MKPCDTCGDGYKAKNLERDTIRQLAQQKANAEKKTFSICKENGGYVIYDAFYAFGTGQQIVEIVSGLSDSDG